MTRLLKGPARRITPLLLAFGLLVATPAVPSARAQEEAAAQGGESKGDPVPGYLGGAILTMLILFIVGKSARR